MRRPFLWLTFEDAMQVAAARACGAEHIVTRNLSDLNRSPNPGSHYRRTRSLNCADQLPSTCSRLALTVRPRAPRLPRMAIYRYSRWDGSQDVALPTTDDLFDRLSEQILQGDDLRGALNRMMRHGMRGEGQRGAGLQDLLERLRSMHARATSTATTSPRCSTTSRSGSKASSTRSAGASISACSEIAPSSDGERARRRRTGR